VTNFWRSVLGLQVVVGYSLAAVAMLRATSAEKKMTGEPKSSRSQRMAALVVAVVVLVPLVIFLHQREAIAVYISIWAVFLTVPFALKPLRE